MKRALFLGFKKKKSNRWGKGTHQKGEEVRVGELSHSHKTLVFLGVGGLFRGSGEPY